MSTEPRTVSVVIPTYNNALLLVECLASLNRLRYPAGRLEIIVADNASSDGTGQMLRTRFTDVRRVDTGKNAGFAAACNRGASEASGDYVAFLNDDAIAEPEWLNGLFAGLDAGGEGAVCAASHIRSRDGREVEFSGASSNLFGVGRPRSVWGWPDSIETPGEGSPLLFASGGAMLVHRHTFLDVGGFDPNFFAYFEDVDLGWRLWALGHRVVYAPGSVVRHIGGATSSRSGAHRRYTLWECNSLAIILKNYESGNMERILSAGLMLLYKRALLAAKGSFDPADYELTGPPDANPANVERLPKISVAHLAAIDRFNALLPRFMEERRNIQARRVRPDAEILPLLGRAFEPQFAGAEYAQAAHALVSALQLYGITEEAAPNRVLILASTEEEQAALKVAQYLKDTALVALAVIGGSPAQIDASKSITRHTLSTNDPTLTGLLEQADAIIAYPGVSHLPALSNSNTPKALISGATSVTSAINITDEHDPKLIQFCRDPGTER